MGNCQAIDNATLIVQHPCGRSDKYYWPVSAYEIMKMNPGHSVALLLTTTTSTTAAAATHRPPTTTTTTATAAAVSPPTNSSGSVRVTRIKLLRPTDTLILGQVYRLITTQEVMKGLCAKKYAKMKKTKNTSESAAVSDGNKEKNIGPDFHGLPRNPEKENKENQVVKHGDRHKARAKPAIGNLKSWQPSLRSISEAAS